MLSRSLCSSELRRRHSATLPAFLAPWPLVLGMSQSFDVPDEATLNRIMVRYPFTPFSEITIRPILDGDTALAQWREIMSEMMGAGPGEGGGSPPAGGGAVS